MSIYTYKQRDTPVCWQSSPVTNSFRSINKARAPGSLYEMQVDQMPWDFPTQTMDTTKAAQIKHSTHVPYFNVQIIVGLTHRMDETL